MFQYWSAPPSLLRVWSRPEEPFPAIDKRFRSEPPAFRFGEGLGARLSRIGYRLQEIVSSRAATPGSRLAKPGLSRTD